MGIAAAMLGAAPAWAQQAQQRPPQTQAPLVLDVLTPFSGSRAFATAPSRKGFSAGDALGVPSWVRDDNDLGDDAEPPDKISFALMDTRDLSLEVSGRVMEDTEPASAPETCDREPGRAACGGPGYGGSVRVGALDDRLRFSSSYSAPDRADATGAAPLAEVTGTTSSPALPMLRERLDVAPLDHGPLRITTYGQYAHYGPLSFGDRSRSEFGLDAGIDRFKVGASAASFATGAEYPGTTLTTRERDGELHAELDLRPLLGKVAAAPSRIAVSRRESRIDPFDADSSQLVDDPAAEIESRRATTDALSPSWDWRFGSSGISVSRTLSKSTLQGDTTDASRARDVDLTQSVRFGTARLSASLGYGDTAHIEPAAATEQSYRAGAELNCGVAGLPDLDLSAHVALSRTASDDDAPTANRSWSVSSGLDFSKLLPDRVVERNGSLRLMGTLGDGDPTGEGAAIVNGKLALTGRIAF
jgi:hypothetical protein